RYRQSAGDRIYPFASFSGSAAVDQMLRAELTFACVATPDNRHFEAAKAILEAGVHVLIEKPSVLSLDELDELMRLAERNNVLAKVVYHKLCDPDHRLGSSNGHQHRRPYQAGRGPLGERTPSAPRRERRPRSALPGPGTSPHPADRRR
ncbi:MAG TPA: hypothetical protein EYP52_07655, partial [Anaerolineae bacterium]|nr:hypothetical protein [Anaerolineae bacterium]